MKLKILTMLVIGSIFLITLAVCKKSSGKRARSVRATKAGLYQSDGSFIPWDDLGIDVETDYINYSYKAEARSPYKVFSENSYNGKLVLPDNITSIGENAFKDCTFLTNIDLPDTLTSIGGMAFYGCTSLTSIDLPDNIKSIDDWTFYGCESLTNIDYAGTMKEWNAINKGLEWNGDSGLKTITCSDGVITL